MKKHFSLLGQFVSYKENGVFWIRPLLSVLHYERGITMEKHVFFTFKIIIEAATENVLQLIMPLKSICNKNFCFHDQICLFKDCKKIETIKSLKNYFVLVFKNCFVHLFRAALCKLIFYYINIRCSIDLKEYI